MDYVIVIFLIALSGLFSGLTLGLLSLDKNELERKISLGDKRAKKVYAVRKRGNLLLCTLLLGNVGVNAAIALFLGSIAGGVIAGFAATGLIVIFGEIIPQAVFSRYALIVGAKTAWLVKIFIFILFPVCFPIAWALDKALGEEMMTIYSKKELMKIIGEHRESGKSSVDADEDRIMRGALSFSDKTAEQVMTPRTIVCSLEAGQALDAKLLKQIKNKGFTRVPVYDGTIDNLIGVLYAKDLIGLKKGAKVGDVCNEGKSMEVSGDTKLDVLLNRFIKTRTHLAFVKDEYGGLEGIVTLEDVVEEILKKEIVDESDRVVDMRKAAKKKR